MRTVLFLITVLGVHLTAGCSMHYLDNEGNDRVIGLVDMTIVQTPDSPTFAGRVTNIQTMGLGVIQNESGTSFSVGYLREQSGYLRNNVLVVGDAREVSSIKGESQ